jgi:hypothetical protein
LNSFLYGIIEFLCLISLVIKWHAHHHQHHYHHEFDSLPSFAYNIYNVQRIHVFMAPSILC